MHSKVCSFFHNCSSKMLTCTAIGHAFAVLGDRDKKSAYDVYGVDPESAGGRRPPPSSRGHPMHHNFAARSGYQSFDGDISPEDLFNMFFGDMGMCFSPL